MIACVSISRLQEQVYIVHIDDQEAAVSFSSISEAIADSADIPASYAKFANIEYGRIRLATMPIDDMRVRARELAAELVRIDVQIRHAVD